MTARQDRRARRREHKIMVVCDACSRRQRLRVSKRPQPNGCEKCGYRYGRYA